MLVSLSAYLALGAYLTLTRRPLAHDQRPTVPLRQQPAPTPTTKIEPQEEDINQKYRIAPEAFAHIDFENYSYGSHRLWSGKKIILRLKNGELDYNYRFEDAGWFNFEDVYYADVTGDGAPEALVLLSHVGCGASCDGGAALFYIYSARKNKLHRIWKYGTGSLAYGCGLKSFSLDKKEIALEVFGRCTKEATESPGSGKFLIADLTRLVFQYNGRRIVRTGLKFLPTPTTDVKNYKRKIRISV